MSREEFVKAYCEADQSTRDFLNAFFELDERKQKAALPILVKWCQSENKAPIEELEKKINAALA